MGWSDGVNEPWLAHLGVLAVRAEAALAVMCEVLHARRIARITPYLLHESGRAVTKGLARHHLVDQGLGVARVVVRAAQFQWWW